MVTHIGKRRKPKRMPKDIGNVLLQRNHMLVMGCERNKKGRRAKVFLAPTKSQQKLFTFRFKACCNFTIQVYTVKSLHGCRVFCSASYALISCGR